MKQVSTQKAMLSGPWQGRHPHGNVSRTGARQFEKGDNSDDDVLGKGN